MNQVMVVLFSPWFSFPPTHHPTSNAEEKITLFFLFFFFFSIAKGKKERERERERETPRVASKVPLQSRCQLGIWIMNAEPENNFFSLVGTPPPLERGFAPPFPVEIFSPPKTVLHSFFRCKNIETPQSETKWNKVLKVKVNKASKLSGVILKR